MSFTGDRPAARSPAGSTFGVLAELRPEPIDLTSTAFSFRSPGRNPLVRLIAHVLIRLLVVSPLPADFQVVAVLFPISIVSPLVSSHRETNDKKEVVVPSDPIPQTPFPGEQGGGEGGSGHGTRARRERALTVDHDVSAAALSPEKISRGRPGQATVVVTDNLGLGVTFTVKVDGASVARSRVRRCSCPSACPRGRSRATASRCPSRPPTRRRTRRRRSAT